ncbi:MAG: phenylalanine--tRNA ligase subunit beta [Planctomycetales bacterium]|nr:phenylalanine--tRNA ligase subunit beta [Planctomycetales bacterium]
MKISLEWLRDYIDTGLPAEAIGDILSNRGFPIESIEQAGEDTVLDVEITSNRGDCLGHIGIARELAAATGKPLKLPAVPLHESAEQACLKIRVEIHEPALCNRYTARVIEHVKNGPSPAWMQRRLEAVGVRCVNNIVDVTNYVMMEAGQPTHAFDYHKVGGQKIIVRRAVNGERLVSIDGTKCDLDDSMLVIADARQPVALAGVMGGLDSEVSGQTTAILLEAAHFEPVTIRRTARRLAIKSEASFRFERQVDTENLEWVSNRCAHLMAEVSGGQVARGIVDIYPRKSDRDTVGMRLGRMRTLLGIDIPPDNVLSIFTALGFSPEFRHEDLIMCTPPSWRHDVYREADLIEEASRSYGYDKVPVEPKIHIEVCKPNLREKTAGKVRAFLTGAGFFETVTVSFVDEQTATLFTGRTAGEHLSVSGVFGKNMTLLRQNLIGSLAQVFQSNTRVGNKPCRLFELADTFIPDAGRRPGTLPNEHSCIGLMMDDEFRAMRGAIEGLVQKICPSGTLEFKPGSLPWAQAGADILLNKKPLGFAGLLNAETAARLDLEKQTVSAAQLDFDLLLEHAGAIPSAKPLPRFPAIVRDLSLIVDEPVAWTQIVSAVQSKAPAELEQIDFGGLYRGKPIADGKKSVTVSLRFRDEQGTLRHETVDGFQNEILAGLTEAFGAELRTA